MIALFIFGGWLIGGVIFVTFLGRTTDAFNYTPKYNEVSPTVSKYTTLFLWPIYFALWILEGLWILTGGFFKAVDRGFNRLVGLDKRR